MKRRKSKKMMAKASQVIRKMPVMSRSTMKKFTELKG